MQHHQSVVWGKNKYFRDNGRWVSDDTDIHSWCDLLGFGLKNSHCTGWSDDDGFLFSFKENPFFPFAFFAFPYFTLYLRDLRLGMTFFIFQQPFPPSGLLSGYFLLHHSTPTHNHHCHIILANISRFLFVPWSIEKFIFRYTYTHTHTNKGTHAHL